MITLNNLEVYIPDEEDKKELISQNITFLKSEDGQDWYESQSKFAKDTLKLIIDQNNIVVSFNTDVSSLWPINKSVVEVSKGDVPEDLALDSTWIYDSSDRKIKKRIYTTEELKTKVDSQVSVKLATAMSMINPLVFASDLDIATEEEKQKLLALKKYVVLLNRVSAQDSYPINVNWPEIPTT